MRETYTAATCETCQSVYEHLPLEYNEDGTGEVYLPVTPCADPHCGAFLCPSCPQFRCDGCDQTHCADHLVSVPDGTETPLHLCRACADELQAELPRAMPPARELRRPFAVPAQIA